MFICIVTGSRVKKTIRFLYAPVHHCLYKVAINFHISHNRQNMLSTNKLSYCLQHIFRGVAYILFCGREVFCFRLRYNFCDFKRSKKRKNFFDRIGRCAESTLLRSTFILYDETIRLTYTSLMIIISGLEHSKNL